MLFNNTKLYKNKGFRNILISTSSGTSIRGNTLGTRRSVQCPVNGGVPGGNERFAGKMFRMISAEHLSNKSKNKVTKKLLIAR